MGIDKIKNWLKKSYSKYGIKTEINPALTLFGIITFSMIKLETGPNPDKWSKKEKNSLADFLKKELKMSFDEFYKHYIDEYSNKTKEQIDSILNQINEILSEKPLISLEEFIKRTEIEKILEYKKFIGRKEEIKELYSFLQDDRKIMVITGEGGSGKTRLALEFAKLVQNKNWQVFFINPYKSFQYLGINSSKKSILLILDNASRYVDRDKVIEFVLNHTLDIDLKLLLLNRSIFKGDIESTLTQRYQLGESYQLKNGDIVSFLKEYFGIEKENAVKIEKYCRNSFVWAAFYAEDFKKGGKIRELIDIVKARTEIYIEDIAVKTDLKMNDIKKAIYILSLFTPINWSKDKNYFENNLFSDEYECLEKIISIASWGKIDILNTTNYNHEYSIEPDPVADFLRFEFIKKDRFSVLLKELLPYMPFRLSYNIFVIPRYIKETEESINLLGEIWKEINLIKGQNLEYFSALIFFMREFSILPFLDIKEANIKQWILCYKELIRSYPEKEVREEFAAALVIAANAYGSAKDIAKMEGCLKELRGLHEKYEEKEVRGILAQGLYNAANYYRSAKDIAKMEGCLKELRGLHEEYKEKKIREELATGLYNAVLYYGKSANDLTKMEGCLKELRGLCGEYKEKKIRWILAQGLYIAASAYGSAKDIAKMEGCLKEATGLYREGEAKELLNMLAQDLYNEANAYGSANDLAK